MARLNVYVPDDLAARAREAGLNVSALTQEALTRALGGQATNAWLDSLPRAAAGPSLDDVLRALDESRDELGA
jgi:post-segregation antitoxin (ccd killing protein)